MPPAGKLSEAIIKDLEEWVKRGAPDPRKDTEDLPPANKPGLDVEQARNVWSFQPPRMPPPPQVTDASWQGRKSTGLFSLAWRPHRPEHSRKWSTAYWPRRTSASGQPSDRYLFLGVTLYELLVQSQSQDN